MSPPSAPAIAAARNTRSIKQARDDLAERRAAAAQRVRDQIDILRNASALRRHEDAAAAMERVLARGRLVFATLGDLLLPQVWTTNAQGALLGHLLEVDDVVYAQALDGADVVVLTLNEAMASVWDDLDARAVWTRVYTQVLRDAAATAEQVLSAERLRRRLKDAVDQDFADESDADSEASPATLIAAAICWKRADAMGKCKAMVDKVRLDAPGTIYSNAQAADFCGRDRRTMNRWRKRRKGPKPVKKRIKGESVVVYPRESLIEWLKSELKHQAKMGVMTWIMDGNGQVGRGADDVDVDALIEWLSGVVSPGGHRRI